MGSSASKVGLLSEPSSKTGHFSFMKSVMSYNKNKDFDEDLKKQKRAPHPWSPTQGPVNDGAASRIRQTNKAEMKFRTKFDPRVTARYDIKALIGQGSFSHVVRVEHRHTRQPFAIKLLEVKGHEGRESCRAELEVLWRVCHANIIRLAEVFETSHRVYLVLELATGGELLERVVARGSFTETDATRALIMVSSGLRYIHALGIIHRDLKPENLLYYHPGQDSRLIITDFGLACWGSKSRTLGRGDWALRTLCGTPEYLAPEMVGRRPYGSAVDMWALGVISYILLSGSMPFDQRSRPRLFKAILRGSYSFHGEPWSSVSNQAKDFIERLLSLNPEQRMTAEQALKHPWLVTMAAGSSKRNLHRPISQNLRQRASRSSARRSSSSGSAHGSRCAASPRSHSGHESCQLGENRLQRSVMVSA
ncbi:serine/threonine-protein kinase H1 [Colossoma macropomum]|uniref:serine/threonine-protein kinase H1 n=1 Tax=Colossoma macropomum TaxID=42526 RepID=UPI001863EBE6|nr:serine/threonine-protein kinase H1 [Colossoma macropomum]